MCGEGDMWERTHGQRVKSVAGHRGHLRRGRPPSSRQHLRPAVGGDAGGPRTVLLRVYICAMPPHEKKIFVSQG